MTKRTRLEISGWTVSLNQRLEAHAERLGLTKAALARSILHQGLPLLSTSLRNYKQQEHPFEGRNREDSYPILTEDNPDAFP